LGREGEEGRFEKKKHNRGSLKPAQPLSAITTKKGEWRKVKTSIGERSIQKVTGKANA